MATKTAKKVKNSAPEKKAISHQLAIEGCHLEVMELRLTPAQYQKYKKNGVSEKQFETLNQKLDGTNETYLLFDDGFYLSIDGEHVPSIDWEKLYDDAQKRYALEKTKRVNTDITSNPSSKNAKKKTFALVHEAWIRGASYECEIHENFDESKLGLDIFTGCLIDGMEYEGISLNYGDQEIECSSAGGSGSEEVFLLTSTGERSGLDIRTD